jgi:hypothetical protein
VRRPRQAADDADVGLAIDELIEDSFGEDAEDGGDEA